MDMASEAEHKRSVVPQMAKSVSPNLTNSCSSSMPFGSTPCPSCQRRKSKTPKRNIQKDGFKVYGFRVQGFGCYCDTSKQTQGSNVRTVLKGNRHVKNLVVSRASMGKPYKVHPDLIRSAEHPWAETMIMSTKTSSVPQSIYGPKP